MRALLHVSLPLFFFKTLTLVSFQAAVVPVARAEIVETLAVSPKDTRQENLEKVFPLPSRTTTMFGGQTESRVATSGYFVGRYGVSSLVQSGTILEGLINVASLPLCGSSPLPNTLACYNGNYGEFLEEFPIPGRVSSQPIFFDGSWFLGTSKGFFIRTEGTTLLGTPLLGQEQTAMWGSVSRSVFKALLPQSQLDAPEKPDSARAQYRKQMRPGWKWYATSSSEFVGTPVVGGNQIFVLTANQYLLSLDILTGKTLWSLRLAPESSLRLNGTSLAYTSRELLVGTDDGQILSVNPKDGSVLWRHLMTTTGKERFRAITAPVAISGRSVIASNGEAQTIRLSLDGRSVEWAYPLGSVAQARILDESLFLGGNDGSVVSLELRTGALNWRVAASPDTSIASVWVAADKKSVVAADKKGRLFQFDVAKGKLLDSTDLKGDVVGEFFRGAGSHEACLSFASNGFSCYVFP
jgi:hypothetical protein